jgi:hypothetical protein
VAGNFDIQWRDVIIHGNVLDGHGTLIRVGLYIANVYPEQSVTVLGIIRTCNFTLSPFTIVAAFKLTNENDDVRMCDLAAYADTRVASNELHPIGALASGQGFYWGDDYQGEEYIINVICRS